MYSTEKIGKNHKWTKEREYGDDGTQLGEAAEEHHQRNLREGERLGGDYDQIRYPIISATSVPERGVRPEQRQGGAGGQYRRLGDVDLSSFVCGLELCLLARLPALNRESINKHIL